MMKLIFLNLLRIGRNNRETSNGPITILKSSGRLVDWIVCIYKSFSKWSAVVSEPLLMDDVMYFKLYPKQYPVWCPNQKKAEFVDVLDRGWNTFKKQSKETSKLEAIPDVFSCSGGVLRVFLGWREFLTSFHAGGSFCSQLHVLRVRASFSRPSKPTINSGDSSHYRQFARADRTGACSFYVI